MYFNRLFFLYLFPAVLTGTAAAATVEIFPGDSFETAAEALQPGDTLIVHEGTYTHGNRIAIDVAGTVQSPAIIEGAAGEAKPLIVLTSSGNNVIDIEGATYLTIRGLEITANNLSGADGINMRSNPSFITLEDLEIHDISVGINFRSSMNNITVRRNEIYNTNDTGEGMYVGCHDGSCAVTDSLIEFNWIHDTASADQGDGIEIKRGSHSNVIRDNVIHDTNYPCIILYGTDGNPRNVVERNVMWDCADSAIQAAADTVFRNNILIPGSGDGFTSQPHAGADPRNLEFVHNTIIGGDTCIRLNSWDGKPGMVFANNAVYCPNDSFSIGGTTGVVVSGNVFLPRPGAFPSSGNTDGRSIAQDFLDASGLNVYPTMDSPLIGAGDPAYAGSDDFNGDARSGAVDAGAYAWSGAANPGWTVAAGFKGGQAAPVVTISATPSSVAQGGSTTLQWAASSADSCEAMDDWSGPRGTSGNELVSSIMSDSRFTLECVNGSGLSASASASVTVTAPPPPPPGGNPPPQDTSSPGSAGPLTLWLLFLGALLRLRRDQRRSS